MAAIVFYIMIGPVLCWIYLYFNFFDDWRKMRPAPPPPPKQADFLEERAMTYQWQPPPAPGIPISDIAGSEKPEAKSTGQRQRRR